MGVQWLPDCHVDIPRGLLPCKSDGGARRKISKASLKGTRILFYGRVPNSFPPLRGTNSTATNYITGTANFNSNKDSLRSRRRKGKGIGRKGKRGGGLEILVLSEERTFPFLPPPPPPPPPPPSPFCACHAGYNKDNFRTLSSQ